MIFSGIVPNQGIYRWIGGPRPHVFVTTTTNTFRVVNNMLGPNEFDQYILLSGKDYAFTGKASIKARSSYTSIQVNRIDKADFAKLLAS